MEFGDHYVSCGLQYWCLHVFVLMLNFTLTFYNVFDLVLKTFMIWIPFFVAPYVHHVCTNWDGGGGGWGLHAGGDRVSVRFFLDLDVSITRAAATRWLLVGGRDL